MMTLRELVIAVAPMPTDAPVYLPGGGFLRSVDSDSNGIYLRGDEEAAGSPDERESIEELIRKGIDSATAAELVAGGYRKGLDKTETVTGTVLTPGTGTFQAEGQAS